MLVRSNEDDFGIEARPRVFEEFHGIRSSSSFLCVPEDHSLGLNVFVDQACYRWAKGSFLIRAYPYEEPSRTSENEVLKYIYIYFYVCQMDVPIWALDARRQRCPDTSPGANADSSFEHGGCMPDTGYYRLMSDYSAGEIMSIPNFSSLVHTVLGGLATRRFVKSP